MNTTKSRKSSAGDEEEIVVHPSTELIADEYEHFLKSTNHIEVHTFVANCIEDQDNVNLFTDTLNKYNYQIKTENAHHLDSDNIFKVLENIRSSINDDTTSSIDGLILYFSGLCRGRGGGNPREGAIDVCDGTEEISLNIQEIWRKFTTSYCPKLKNKPKIFIFHITGLAKIEMDGKMHMFTTYSLAYETPAEADILVVYHKTDTNYQTEFAEQLCGNIEQFGKSEDIISLVTCIDSNLFDTRPMIISTLTRKFYFTASEFRGLHLDIDQSHKQLKAYIEELHEKLSQVTNSPKKEKKNFSFNFRKKRTEGESRKMVSNETNKNDVNNQNSSTTNPNKNFNGTKTDINRVTKMQKVSKCELDGERLTIQNSKTSKYKLKDEQRGKPKWSFSLKKQT